MKRSEAVQAIFDMISVSRGFSDYHRADIILARLESAGMLPPRINRKGMLDVFAYDVNEWEPEDPLPPVKDYIK